MVLVALPCTYTMCTQAFFAPFPLMVIPMRNFHHLHHLGEKSRRVNAMCSPIDDPKKGISPPPPFPRHPPGTLATPKNHHQGGQGGPLGSSRWTPKTCIRLGEIWVPWAGERAGEEPGVPPYVRQLLLLCPTTNTGQCPPSPHTPTKHTFRHPPNFHLLPICFASKANQLHRSGLTHQTKTISSHIFLKFPNFCSNIVLQCISS